MAEGQLRCAGSSLFLKRQYGVGYQLTIEKQPRSAPTKASGEGVEVANDEAVDDKLEEIVTGAVSEASLLSNVGTEMSFQLPIGAASNFTPMFEQLDEAVDDEAIVTYGVSITTLDEVFLLVARGGHHGEKKELRSSRHMGGEMNFDEDKSVMSRIDLEHDGLFLRHVQSLFQKRALNFKRDKKAWICSTILPSFFVFLGFLIFRFVTTRGLDALTLSLDQYNVDTTTTPINPILTNAAGDNFRCQPGRCLVPGTFTTSGTTYEFCGGGGGGFFANVASSGDSCSISESEAVFSRITQKGAVAEPLPGVESIDQVRSFGLVKCFFSGASSIVMR